MIQFDKINPNLSKLSDYFIEKSKRFFNSDGSFKMEYFERVKCYYCGGSGFVSEFYDSYGFRHIRCNLCGLVYVNPRFKEGIAHDLYSEDDYTQYYKIKLLPALDYRRNVLAVNKYKQIVSILGRNKGRVLDIGCGLGEVLSVFRENRWDVLGVEFNPFAADYAGQRFDVPVISKSIYDFDEKVKFDAIMLWGVLEHLYDPLKILDKCNRLLYDHGILVIEVPSADSFLVRYVECTKKRVDRIIEGDRHLMLFSITAFKGMLGKSRFTNVELFSNGLDIATLNRLFMKKALSDEAVNIIQKELDESLQGDLLRGFFSKKKEALL